jgi:glc operon protein GlcG
MSATPAPASGARLIDEVERLFPEFLQDPIDREQSRGNAAVAVIEPGGRIHGRIFGDDPARGQWCLGIAHRKLAQVWRTGYATGHFEELVYAGRLDESKFGVNRPDFIGWEGGVPLEDASGRLFAAAFSGFRGIKDIQILSRAAPAAGLRVRRNDT